ncbi:aminotransferase class I/II-fold pyridoxal phosphate-dependent enzyme [Fulvivirga ligni]|uniref:aminotransferase class I/II-fold pyridoxal phosphate-dependent enzyme n=1 Tax=Fulvivirga ligni TaxID=2904246 RepID=UPI001F473DAC|nr:8-amino-7-oxononanoate synthase [Fulvivirga ligni]UII21063.1 8-amino-7-oxononanoate synthase [Fulvivirga ligni]
MLEKRLAQQLQLRKDQKSFRQLITPSGLVDFCSNDYLGLARSTELFSMIQERADIIKKNGAAGSRLLSGNSSHIENTENKLADIFKSEKALIFNSGYNANLAVLSSIPQKSDTIIYDEKSHACIKDGARLSLANRYSFKHNDIDDLRKKISKATGQVFIVAESIYSMDGDECPLKDIVDLAEKTGAEIILDEAHSTGILGNNGNGLAGTLNLHNKIFARIYTFGKAMGIHGAALAGSQTLIDYTVNFARPFIYTTAPSPHQIAAIDASFDYLNSNNSHKQKLENNIRFYKEQIQKISGLESLPSNHPIQGIIIQGNQAARAAAEQLQKKGLDVRAILSPTVKKGSERLRICIHSFNTSDEISLLIDSLAAL